MAVTEPGDVVWEPFGGLCSASVAAVALGRRAFAAETDPAFADLAIERLRRSGTAARVPAAAMVAR
jgi:site-specific DNA-methyltransferase (adenine-specific)